MDSITLFCPAKINLTLEILGTRPDGYHLLRSIMQPVDLFDELTVSAQSGQGIELASEGLKLPDIKENLVYKSAELYLKETGISARLRLKLKKKIPIQAGLGGGSSNAAAALIGLNRIYNALSTDRLIELASGIGADVPFFIHCRTALIEGVGEKITVLNDFPLLNYLIVKPSFGLSTADVYSKWDELNSNSSNPLDINKVMKMYQKGEIIIKNELEHAAISLNPGISKLIELLKQLGCDNVLMSGSGTAVFAIFPSQNGAKDVYDYLNDSGNLSVFIAKGISGWHRLS
ncbi:MAG: 4-(cytidine 5'-diphospho)-2-C-methyl-D-erythritol kinase [Candidatus Dadabacteria bacterium]|nr:4-(cytidine 5'-diphospho)-2-C-methyl-D-erythritol kinase [Candidatus Dadabacteria bacterium]NIS09762.1 4-(cytidine 5'-diphospho)-2-C-methyl-D-erythritol kinase [Candidatus Dadabacteria bacterium]NIY22530.1 4-(cytidine 5'-diphospho)-2-C-methyl-D-erythritol kinase [Candidatus Dadabacteria bacterium]